MRIRFLTTYDYGGTRYQPGDVIDIPDTTAKAWLGARVAMQDKSLDGSSERKELIPLGGASEYHPAPDREDNPPLPPANPKQKPKRKTKRNNGGK